MLDSAQYEATCSPESPHYEATCSPEAASATPNATKQHQKLVDDSNMEIFYWITCTVLATTISVLGIVTNGMNIAVFVSNGFKETINISLFGLAISDVISLVTLFLDGVAYSPALPVENFDFLPNQVYHLVGGWPHVLFIRISGWIIAFVSFERFLCIAFPLKVKAILTPFNVKIIICCIYVVVFASVVPIYYGSSLGWVFVAGYNKTMIGLVFTDDKEEIEAVALFFNNTLSAFLSFFLLIGFTTAIVIRLKQKGDNLRVSSSQAEKLTSRDNKLARMMVVVSTIFIICLSPTIISVFPMIFVPELFSITGPYANMYLVVFTLAFLVEGVNSSINIFVYYHMSSRFKETFDRLFFKTNA